jgi:hypothetical protein
LAEEKITENSSAAFDIAVRLAGVQVREDAGVKLVDEDVVRDICTIRICRPERFGFRIVTLPLVGVMQEAVSATDAIVKCGDHEMPMHDCLEAIKYKSKPPSGFRTAAVETK